MEGFKEWEGKKAKVEEVKKDNEGVNEWIKGDGLGTAWKADDSDSDKEEEFEGIVMCSGSDADGFEEAKPRICREKENSKTGFGRYAMAP